MWKYVRCAVFPSFKADATSSCSTRLVFHLERQRHWCSYYRIAASCLILAIIYAVYIGTPAKLDEKLGLQLWNNDASASRNEDYSSVMLWLCAANAVSILSVGILVIEAFKLQGSLNDMTLSLDEEAAKHLLELNSTALDEAKARPIAWSKKPIWGMFGFAGSALMVNLLACAIPWATRPVILEWVLMIVSACTGILYLFLMTCSDVCAINCYRRVSCLRSGTNDELTGRYAAQIRLNDAREVLSDYERIFWYVDVPFIAAVTVVFLHGLFMSGGKPYYWGFVAGATAAQIIIANGVSLIITASETRVIVQTQ